jgi:HEAT repeat protein
MAACIHDRSIPKEDRALSLQEAIASEQFAEMYLTDEPQHLERLRGMTEDPAGAAPYVRVVPELLRQGRYQSALTILRAVESWSATSLPSAASFKSLLESVRIAVSESDLLPALFERFRGGSAETRQKVIEVFATLGWRGVSPLIELLARSGDADLRRYLIAALAQVGASALWEIRLALEGPKLPARCVRDLLAAMAQIRGLEASNTVRPFLQHPDACVREEALAALVRITGRHAEPELLAALKDPVAKVRRRALVCLGVVGSSTPQVVDFLCEVVRKRREGEREEDDQLQIQACQALAEVGRTAAPLLPRIESVLIEALDLDGSKESHGRWGGSAGKSDAVRGAICAALGQIGGPNAAESLGRMLGEKSLLLRDRAARALRELESRLALQAA